MVVRMCVVAVVLSLAISRTPALAASPSPSSVVASPVAPSGCVTPDPATGDDLPTAFAYKLTDRDVLHFLTEIASASPQAAHDTLDSIVRAAGTPAQVHAAYAVQQLCPTAADLAAEARADRFVSNLWSLDGFDAEPKLQAIKEAVEGAVLVLGHGSAIEKGDAASMLMPFAAIELPVPRIAPTGARCVQPNVNASTAHIAPLLYPPLSGAVGASGSVSLKVALSAAADVMSVSVFKDMTGGGLGTKPLLEAAIVSAGETTYRPAVYDCVSRDEFYVFKANFSRR